LFLVLTACYLETVFGRTEGGGFVTPYTTGLVFIIFRLVIADLEFEFSYC
jgi:hypothetical protein